MVDRWIDCWTQFLPEDEAPLPPPPPATEQQDPDAAPPPPPTDEQAEEPHEVSRMKLKDDERFSKYDKYARWY